MEKHTSSVSESTRVQSGASFFLSVDRISWRGIRVLAIFLPRHLLKPGARKASLWGHKKPSCNPKLPLPVCFLDGIPKPGLGEANSYPGLAMREQAGRRRPLQLGNDLLETRSSVAIHPSAGSVHAQSKVPVSALANAEEKVQKGRRKPEPEPLSLPHAPWAMGGHERSGTLQLVSGSTMALQYWDLHHRTSTPRSTPPGSKQSGSATLPFRSPRCLRLCGQGRASMGSGCR